MTLSDLSRLYPGMVEAANLERQLLAPIGISGGAHPQQHLDVPRICHLVLWNEIAKLKKIAPALNLTTITWESVCRSDSKGQAIESFLGSHGQLCDLPASFVDTFLDGKRLDGRLRAHPETPDHIQLIQGNKLKATLPVSLLKHLMDQRKK